MTDVKGVHVGRRTIAANNVQTGVTVILPTEGDIFHKELAASYHVINDFGETDGLIQLEELGILESPATLTDTLCVGAIQQALVCCMLQDHPEIGTMSGTMNVVVKGCSDGYPNNTRACSVQKSNIYEVITNAGGDFTLEAVGAGRGMSYLEMKGGIGLAPRVLELNGEKYMVRPLVSSNFGLRSDYIKEDISLHDSVKGQVEQGSIIIILATDIPMPDRQLKRVCKRMPVALARLGSHLGNGSGDVVTASSIANKIPHSIDCSFISQTILHEQQVDEVFRVGIEAYGGVIQSFLGAMEAVIGREGHYRHNLKDTAAKMKKE